MSRFRAHLGHVTGLIGVVTLAACADGLGPDAHRVSFSFATLPPASFAARPFPESAADEVVIARAWFVLEELELESESPLAGCSNDDDADDNLDGDGVDDDSECEIESGPFLVELPLAGDLRSAISVAVPAGRYREIEYKIDRVERSDAGGDAFLTAHPQFVNTSVRVEGTYNGRPFVYSGTLEQKIELEFQPPVVIDGSGSENITVAVDMSRWFRTSTGAPIDPATANPGGPNAGIVASNIQASFAAYEDDDHDGRDDSSDE